MDIDPPPTAAHGGAKTTPDSSSDNEDGDICRICRNPGDADNPLRYPCACSGSIKFVHQDCLLQWLNLRNARHCEVCKHPFSFSHVYADNPPARLPFWEIVVGMAMKYHHMVQCFVCLSFKLSLWFLIISFITFWTWSFSFARSFGAARRLFLSRISTTFILTDCAHGFLLSISIAFITFAVWCLRDYIIYLREHTGLEREREDDGDGNGAHVGGIQRDQANRNLIGEGNGGDVVAQGIGRAGQIVIRNAEDIPEFEWLDGVQFDLVETAYDVLARNFIFLGFVALVPFHLGRFILYHLSWILSSATSPMVLTVALDTEQTLSLVDITSRNALTALINLTSEKNLGEVINVIGFRLDGSPNNDTSRLLVDILKGGIAGASRLSDATTLAVGYMFIFVVVIICHGVVALVRYSRSESLVMGRFYSISAIENISSLFRLFLLVMIRPMIVYVFFPLMLGWWLDVCTLRMFGKSIAQRVEFFSVSPLASSLIHWVVGIAYLLQLVMFAMFLREVLCHGVLYFLRDPADPHMNPLTDVNPTDRYALNILLSAAFHGSIIVLLVFLPVKLAMWIAPSIFPLDISVSVSFTEIPNYILFFQFLIPFAVEHFKMHTTIKSLLLHWFTAVGWALGLTDYLLGRHEDGGQVNGNDLGRRDRIHAQLGGEDLAVVGDFPSEYLKQDGHATANANSAEGADGDEHSDLERYAFVRGIVLLLLIAWMTLLIIISASIVVPLSIGRVLLNAAVRFLPISHGTNSKDIYAFAIGSFVIWAALAGIRYCVDLFRTRRDTVLQNQIWKWCAIVVKSSVLLIWYFFIPVLIGLLFKLLVSLPMLVPVEESPVFVLYDVWVIGLGVLKLWIWLVMLGIPLMDESWQAMFMFVMAFGFSRLPARMVLRVIMAPIMMKLLTALCVPYVLARGVFPLFGYSSVVNSAVYRFAWLGCLGLSLLCFCAKRLHFLFTNLHNSIRDDRYLIGRGLHNFGEAK